MRPLKIRSLELRDFRGFRHATVHCDADVVLIYGRNGVGKTTIFDAIEYALFAGNRRLEELGQTWEQHLPNVHGDGTFQIRLRFQSEEQLDVTGSGDGITEGIWAGHSTMRDFIYDRLMKNATLGRRNVAAIHDLSLATHLLVQSAMAKFAASGTLDSEKLAALTGSGYLERCREKAEQTRSLLSKRHQNAQFQSTDVAARRQVASDRVDRFATLMQHRSEVVDTLRRTAKGTSFETTVLQHLQAQSPPLELAKTSSHLLDEAQNFDERVRVARTLLNVTADSLDDTSAREAVTSLQKERDRAVSVQKDISARLDQERQTADRQQREHSMLSQHRELIVALLQDVTTVAGHQERLPRLVSATEVTAKAHGNAETAVKSIDAEASRTNASLAESRAELARRHSNVKRLQNVYEAWKRAETQALEAAASLKTAETEAAVAKGRHDTATKTAEAASLAYDREHETFARSVSEIDSLVGELRGALSREEDCPLCGTHFGSATALYRAIESHAAKRSETHATAQRRLEQQRRTRDEALLAAQAAHSDLQRALAQVVDTRERMGRALTDRERTDVQLRALVPATTDVDSLILSMLAAVELAARETAGRESAATDVEARLAVAREAEKDARGRARVAALEHRNLQDQIDTMQKRITATAAELGVSINEASLRSLLSKTDAQLADSSARHAAGVRNMRQYENELQELTQRLADFEKRLAAEQSRLQDVIARRETYQRQVGILGLQFNAPHAELNAQLTEATIAAQRLRALADAMEELARIETSATVAELNRARAELREIDLENAKVEDEIGAIHEAFNTVTAWEQTLRKRVDVAIESFVIPRAAEIDRTFRSLIADPFRFQRVELRHGEDGLELGLVFRNFAQASGSPEYYLSAAQMSALALSIFLSLARSQQWSNLDVIMLDDPVQHLDDLDCVALLDGLRNVARQSPSKQLMISTCDRMLYHQMIRKFTLATAPSATSLIAMSLEEDLKDGVVIRYDVGGSGTSRLATG